MTIVATATELEHGYEALRAQAVGEIPNPAPRGLAVFLRRGLCAWMCACPPQPQPVPSRPVADATADIGLAGMSGELVRLLAAMVVNRQKRSAHEC